MGKKIILIGLLSFCLLQFSMAQSAPAKTDLRTYLPGDFVHVIVEAPVDTSQINATMPDGTVVGLIQERRANVWRGIWQVPVDFNKGAYAAKLSAVDVQGNVFEGETDPFDVGELSMITLVGKPTRETAAKAPLREIITTEAPAAVVAKAKATGDEELLKKIMKIISQPSTVSSTEMISVTKDELIHRNFVAGKENLDRSNLTGAAAYFRIVLYLNPGHRAAGLFLAQTEEKLKEEKKKAQAEQEQRALILAISAGAGALVLVVIFLLIVRAFTRGAGKIRTVPEKEKQALWYKKAGWNKNPFAAEAFKQLFASDSKLEKDGFKNFVLARLKEAGGQGVGPFTESALDEIYALSKGKPKAALKIADWSVNQAIRLDEEKVTAEIVKGYERIGLRNILIADDEEIIRASLEAILQKGGGYETDCASDGVEALKKIKENLYGLVLMDIDMPKLDGYEVLKQARAIYPGLPVVFVTGKGTPQKTIESMAQYNLTGYIEKPFTPEKVLDAVARILKS